MSLSTTFSHVIFGLPLPLLPSTVISILFFTQSFPSFLNTPHPSQPATYHYIINPFNTHTLPQLSICPLLSQWHSTHPSHHSHFSSLNFYFLLSIHCPCFTSIYYWTLNTCPIDFPFQLQCHLLTCQNTWQLPKLFPVTSHSWNWCQSWLSFSIQHINQVPEFADS